MEKIRIKNSESLAGMGFTLIELLVVIAIIGMLAGILLPTINKARERANIAVCAGNLKVIGEAFNLYNIDRGIMPPTADAFPLSGNNEATNQIGVSGATIVPVGLGYFYNDPNLTITTDDYIDDFAVLACPSSNYVLSSQEIKSDWNADNDTFSTYIYRAESGYPSGEETLILSDAKPAIVMDYNRRDTNEYNHQEDYVNILFRNGYVKGVENTDDNVSAPVGDKILTLEDTSAAEKNRVFQNADDEQ
jgi:prepilin-type N-terminal cleavage/methylation domain-containing protein